MELSPGVFQTTLFGSSIQEVSTRSTMPSANSGNRLSVCMAAIFLAGEMAGSGVLALPRAVADAGWTGLAFILLFCFTSGYSGTRLARCWIIIEERFPEYLQDSRSPYPTIAFRAFGVKMKRLVSVSITLTLFGVSTVFLLLLAQFLHALSHDMTSLSYCYWIIIGGLAVMPFTWFGTPKEFWPVAVFALVSTSIACVLVLIQIIIDINKLEEPPRHTNPTFQTISFAFGTILFAFGGASVFPTVQNDMENRKKFPISVILTFAILLLLYFPVATTGYVGHGDKVCSNIVQNLSSGVLSKIVQSLLAVHLFFAYVIAVNPFCQQLEDYFNIPNCFNWKRCVFRSIWVGLSIFVGLTVPHFGNILALIGGSTVTLLTFVFPPLFYMTLCDQKQEDWKDLTLTLHERTFLWELIVIGILGGVASTWSALENMFNSATFTVPCFINPYDHHYTDIATDC